MTDTPSTPPTLRRRRPRTDDEAPPLVATTPAEPVDGTAPPEGVLEPVDGDENPTTKVPTGRDLYGRPTDVVEVTDPAAVVEWDESRWNRGPAR